MKRLLILITAFVGLTFELTGGVKGEVPVAYNGRFRPVEAQARLWLHELEKGGTTKNELKSKGLQTWNPENILWQIHFRNEEGVELAAQEQPRSNSMDEMYFQTAKELESQRIPPKELSIILDSQFPLAQRLNEFGDDLKILPGKFKEGTWYSLKALNIKVYDSEKGIFLPVSNFTTYSNIAFDLLRNQYAELQKIIHLTSFEKSEQHIESFAEHLLDQYRAIAGTPYTEAYEKALYYPSLMQLKAEQFYYHYPLIIICLFFYGCAATLMILSNWKKGRGLSPIGLGILCCAFLIHTSVLVLRCYILARPPVSNMFETIIYVPWVAVLISLTFPVLARNQMASIAASLVAFVCLVILELTNLNTGLENVQAVLDSQYWLILHVLMVVGSYGLFALSALLAHVYLGSILFRSQDAKNEPLSKLILQTIYIGTALLIPGTLLGGVWAAQSWGRFWDWDPKESWAFISICIYLIGIHAYRFHHIGHFGLSIGSIIGFQAIIFTWYGVNYILGTGFHSYGFGSGGEGYYFILLVAEVVFIGAALFCLKRAQRALLKL